MSADKKNSGSIKLEELLGAPPLIRGEDKDRYLRLQAAVEDDVKPKTVFDLLYVRELTDKLWQQQRCRQSAASLVEGAYVDALASLLRPFCPPPEFVVFAGEEDEATRLAREYCAGEAKPKRLDEIDTRLAVHAISQEQIRAKAMQLCGSGISMFSRMEANCETSLRMLLKENNRRHAKDRDADGSDGD